MKKYYLVIITMLIVSTTQVIAENYWCSQCEQYNGSSSTTCQVNDTINSTCGVVYAAKEKAKEKCKDNPTSCKELGHIFIPKHSNRPPI